jgi:lysophospholipase L1-like esterase
MRSTMGFMAILFMLCALGSARAGDGPISLKKGDRIVFLGDSITQAGVGPKGYVTLIKAALAEKDTGVEVIGAGISGNKVTDLQQRLERDVLKKNPTLVVIYIGINDVWHGENDPARGTPKDRFEAGLKDIIQKIKAAGANVLLCTPTVIGEKHDGSNKLDSQLDDYSAISRKVAQELKVPLCDLRKEFVAHLKHANVDNKEKGLLTGDRVHLSEAGNRLVAEVMLKALGRRVKTFTIGKDTTVVMGPLDKDGRVDYVTALNDRLQKGVTPDNNAVVLIWKAFGPHPEGATMPPEFFQRLGIPAPPEKGDYFVDLFDYLKTRLKVDTVKEADAIGKVMDQTSRHRWTAKQHPDVAGWLKDNENVLAVVMEATQRSHYYSPLIPVKKDKNDAGLLNALLPGVQKCRGLAQALVTRAMLHLGEGRHDDAWQDLLTCHRLGRHVSHGGTLIESLVGIAINQMAAVADLALLDDAKPDAKQAKAYLADLQKLPPIKPVADLVDTGERFMFLDCVMMLDRQGLSYFEKLAHMPSGSIDPAVQKNLDRINWDPAMRNGNRIFDRLAAGMRDKDSAARAKQLNEVDNDIKKIREDLRASEIIKAFVDPDTAPEELGRVLGDVLIPMLIPAAQRVQQAGDRLEQTQHNLEIAFALAAYQRENGMYPQKLEALTPKYLPSVPLDLFSGKALVYMPSEKGYLLYSVGMNGRDEQGRGPEDTPPGDDLSVRMPLPRK